MKNHGKNFDEIELTQQAVLKALLQLEIRANTWDSSTGEVTVSTTRAKAISLVAMHYSDVFQINDTDTSRKIREQ
ncbi:MAG: nitric oxide reductase subunit B [Candidatus Azotimanducaceae bacterium]|jgi:nitric oxide reductase subunit B